MARENAENALVDVLREGFVSLYDFKGRHLPDLISDKSAGTLSLFVREGKNPSFRSDKLADNLQVQHYKSLSQIPAERTDIHLLDGEAIKLLLAKYPSNAPYSLVRIALRSSWLLGLPGLLRLSIKRAVRIRGFVNLKSDHGSQKWLILEYVKFRYPEFSLSTEVGIQGLLDFLKEEKIQYVVLRFFDKLPELFRAHGDLDLLIADEEVEKVRDFLRAHPGPITVDPRGISSQYYPQNLAAQILESAVDGPAGSRIPAPREAFFSFGYHAIYHKGFGSGIPSRLSKADVNRTPRNDYSGMLGQMAKGLDIQVPIDMESLDDYFHQEGWRPTSGIFATLAHGNEWMRRRFWTEGQANEVGLGVLILKEKALRLGLIDEIIKEIEQQQFTVIRQIAFDEVSKKAAMSNLRGGNWRSAAGVESNDFTPAVALVVLDTRPFSVFHATQKRRFGLSRLTPLKYELRDKFDDDDPSVIHSTDNPGEAWEYIGLCFPEEATAIRGIIDEYHRRFKPSPWQKIRYAIEFILYRIRNLRMRRLRGRIGGALIRILID